ncbi:MAG: triple tyrosine motif-containing protein, partial [Flavobacteriales bacterium]
TREMVLIHQGEGFRKVPVKKGKTIYALDTDGSGRIFLGGNNTFGVILPTEKGKLTYHSMTPLVPDSIKEFGLVWDVWCAPKGGVYFMTNDRIFHYKKGRIGTIPAENRFHNLYVPEDRLIVQDIAQGLFRIEDGEKEYLENTDSLAGLATIRGVFSGKKGWTVFTSSDGFFRYRPSSGQLDPFPLEDQKKDPPYDALFKDKLYTVTTLEPDRNPYGAAYAVGTIKNGVYFIGPEGKVLTHMGKEEGLPAYMIWQLVTNKYGDLWAATNNGIALIHSGAPFTQVEEGQAFQKGVMDVERYPPAQSSTHPDIGSLFLGTKQGLWKWHQEKESFVNRWEVKCREILLYPISSDKSRSHGSSLILAMMGRGVIEIPPSAIENGNEKEEAVKLTGKYAKDMAHLPATAHGIEEDLLIVGGRNGIFVIDPTASRTDSTRFYLKHEKIPGPPVQVQWESKKQASDSIRIWAGTPSSGALAITTDSALKVGNVTRYDTSNSLPRGAIRVFRHPDKKDQVLLGTEKGLYKTGNGSVEPYCELGKQFCEEGRQILRMSQGPYGEVWLNDITDGPGIIKKAFLTKEKERRVASTRFRALNIGTVRDILPEKERVWMGGDHGLAAYHREVRMELKDWNCFISEVRGADDSLLFGGHFAKKNRSNSLRIRDKKFDRVLKKEQTASMEPVLPYSSGRLLFEFTAPYPVLQEKVMYRYRLNEFDSSWSNWTKETKKEYTSLPVGTYRFDVQARNVFLQKSRTRSYSFRILPPWYRTWWAYGAYTIAGTGFVWLLIWLNGRRLLRQKERLEAIVQNRTQEIQEQKAVIEEAHNEITESIDYARKIQYALLQNEEQLSDHLPEHFILFKPQAKVSGDFYWIKEQEGYLYIAAVDCTGHGVPGAFMSMLGISQLNEILANGGT